MPSVSDVLSAALKSLPPKPDEGAKQDEKKRYSELVSNAVAQAMAEALRQRGLEGTRPSPPGENGVSGAERRLSGGIGAKKVDVTWTTEESGLLFALSIKSINWRDSKTKNFQKNLTNRRESLLFESVTLHRRFPYAVLAGFFILDKGAADDGTAKRESTFQNAHARLKLFTGRLDPAGREEQYERLYIVLLDATPLQATFDVYAAGTPDEQLDIEDVFDELMRLIADRNPDFYRYESGHLKKVD